MRRSYNGVGRNWTRSDSSSPLRFLQDNHTFFFIFTWLKALSRLQQRLQVRFRRRWNYPWVKKSKTRKYHKSNTWRIPKFSSFYVSSAVFSNEGRLLCSHFVCGIKGDISVRVKQWNKVGMSSWGILRKQLTNFLSPTDTWKTFWMSVPGEKWWRQGLTLPAMWGLVTSFLT